MSHSAQFATVFIWEAKRPNYQVDKSCYSGLGSKNLSGNQKFPKF